MEQLREDIKEIFRRLGEVETATKVFEQAKEFFSKEVDTLKKLFEKHEVDEEKRFVKFEAKQEQILKFMWVALGVGVTVQIVVMPLVLYIILKG